MSTDGSTAPSPSARETASACWTHRLMDHDVEFVHPMELLAEAFET